MCMNCGCGQPEDRRGQPANITRSDLQAAADANGQSLRETARHILESVESVDRSGDVGGGGVGGGGEEHRTGLAQPAGTEPAEPAAHGTPGSES